MPAVVKLEAGKGWLGECRECGIGPYGPAKQRDADYREQVRRRLEAVAQEHNAKHHAPREGQQELKL